jgi:NAD(P)-dependent dehydrogenase (short-subunit alcohol dehydrogenase family)
LNGLTSALASEIAPVRINSVLPGAIRTPGTEFLYESQGEAAITHGYPLGSGTAEDVAGLVDFLMSDAARWITGQQFVIDGGRTAGL